MHPPPRRLRLMVVSLLTVSILGALDHTIVSTSLATIAGDLGALGRMSWVVVAYTLAATVLLPVLGVLGDRVGPRRVLLVSLVVFLIASAACGFATSIGQLTVARAVQGLGGAGLQLMSQSIVGAVASPRQRPRLLAIVGAAFPVAILVGPLVGGVLTDTLGWQWVFWINIPFGAAAWLLALWAVPRLGPERDAGRSPGDARGPRFDVAGAAVLAGSTTALVLAATWGADVVAGDEGTPLLATLVASAASLFGVWLLLRIERRAAQPVLPLDLLVRREVVVSAALAAIIGVGLFSMVAYIPTYVQMTQGVSATTAGVVPIATVFGMLVGTLGTGRIVARTGRHWVWPPVGCALGVIGFTGLAAAPGPGPLWWPALCLATVGVGTGMFMNLLVAVAQSAAPASRLGAMTATVNLVRQVGATAGSAAIGALIGVGVASRLQEQIGVDALSPDELRAAAPPLVEQVGQIYDEVTAPIFAGLAAVYLIGLLMSLALPHRRLRADDSYPDEAAPRRPLGEPSEDAADPTPTSRSALAADPTERRDR